MNKPFNLNIKTPCHENFNNFTATANGGFCGSCEKEVIDFTKMNSDEIINYFKTKKTQNTCGKFNNLQLRTYNQVPQNNKKFSFIVGIGLAILSFFTVTTTQAQNTQKENSNNKNNNSEIKDAASQNNILIKGNVSENNLPLPGVNIILKGSNFGTQTNFDGDFEFPEKLKKGDILSFSFLGFETREVVINGENSAINIELKIDMNPLSCVVMGKVAVKKVYKSKRPK